MCLYTSALQLSVALSDRPYKCLLSMSFFIFSTLSSLSFPTFTQAKIQPASKQTPGFQSLFSWASYRINPLLVLIDVRVTSSARDRSSNNVWSLSQSLFKPEQHKSHCNWVTNKATIIFMVTVMVNHKYWNQRHKATSKTNNEGFTLELTYWSFIKLMIYDIFNWTNNLRGSP